jgi:hypothetical protein
VKVFNLDTVIVGDRIIVMFIILNWPTIDSSLLVSIVWT